MMKKLLLGSTALVAASVAAASAQAAEWEVSVGGYYNAMIAYADSGDAVPGFNEINFGSDSEVYIGPEITLDNGIRFGVNVRLDLESDDDSQGDDLVDEAYLVVSGSFGRVVLGQENSAGYLFGEGFIPGMGGNSVNNNDTNNADAFRPLDVFTGLKYTSLRSRITTQPNFTRDDMKITYFTPRFAGFQLGGSFAPNPCKNEQGYADCVYDEFGRNALEFGGEFLHDWDVGSFRIAGSYMFAEGGNSRDNPTEWSIGASITYGGFELGAQYAAHDTRYEDPFGDRRFETNEDWAVSAKYQTGPVGFMLQYGQSDQGYRDYNLAWGGNYSHENDYENVMGGVQYSLGPGISVGATAQSIEYQNNTNGPLMSNNFSADGFAVTSFLSLSF